MDKAKAHYLFQIQHLIFQLLLVHMDGGKDQPSSKKKMSVVVGTWGGNGGAVWDYETYHGIKLKLPEEFLISVSGHYCPVVHGTSPVIRSLTFKSNQRTFGPYGVEEGTPFTFSMEGGRIAGFNGRSGWFLDSIGFRLSRVQSPKLFQKMQKGFQRFTNSVSKSST
ncbi:hypothetical protein CRYUN_Cryun37aG0056100 [Craigia yunnanensis]